MKHTSIFYLLAALLFVACNKVEQTNNTELSDIESVAGKANSNRPAKLRTRVVTESLSYPWEILWGPDNFIWMTERGGRISRVNPNNGTVTQVYNVPDVVSNGEGGLLGMVLHPTFSSTPFVYVVYNYNNGSEYKEKVVRFIYNGTTLASPLTIIDNITAASIHNGSRLLIDGDKLFITTGDANNLSLPQNTSSLNGKVLRVNLNGSIPTDNPYGNAVWSTGHRNAQGLVFAGTTLFSSEHGPSNDDEINIIERGRNYGWPDVHGYCNTDAERTFCSFNNVKEPITAWTPTIAVSGIDYYNFDHITQWKNSLLVATLKNRRLYQLKLNEAKTEIIATNEFFNNSFGRLRDVCIAPNGKVYVCTSNGSNDKIVEIRAN